MLRRVLCMVLFILFSASIVCNVNGIAQTKRSIYESFKVYVQDKVKKSNPGEDIICTSPGTHPKSDLCYNTGGEQNCIALKKAFEQGDTTVMNNYKAALYRNQNIGLVYHKRRSLYRRLKKGLATTPECPNLMDPRCPDPRCPSPCGCWLASPPKVDGKSKTKVWKKKDASWNEIKSVLKTWQVPEELESQFEIATMFDDRATFVNFDFYLQPNGDKAEYEVALGAARKNNGVVEIGYLYAGKATAIVSPSYSCGRAKKKKGGWFGKGGTHLYCNKNGVPPEKINAIKKALEYFAYDTIKFDGSHNYDMTMMDSMGDNMRNMNNVKFNLDYDDGDNSLWALNEETKNLIGDYDTTTNGDNFFSFDQMTTGNGRNNNLLHRLHHRNKNCRKNKIIRWTHDTSELCPFDYVGKPYVAKVHVKDSN